MKKVEYIEKYGEEAWERRRELRKAWDKKYREMNKEKVAAANKNWRNNNPVYYKEYYSLNQHKLSDYRKKWGETDVKKSKAIILASNYNYADKNRGLDISNNVDAKWIVNNIFSKKCVYCGDQEWEHLGCDRIDNSKPHTAENVNCCCRICNIDRSNNFSVEEFKEYRKSHPRECDIPKAPAIQLSETGALKKRAVRNG